MAINLQAKARQTTSVSRVAEGLDVYVKALRDGTLSTIGFIQAMSLEGRVFTANAGTATTPITCGAGSIDTTEPDLMVIAPSGTAIIPVEIVLNVEAYGTTAIFEAMASCGTGGALGTDTDLTIYNTNMLSGNGSNCSAGAASNNDATYWTANSMEFARWNAAKAVTVATADDDSAWPPVQFYWSAAMSGKLYVVSGSGAGFAVFAAAQASTAFITGSWIELPASVLE